MYSCVYILERRVLDCIGLCVLGTFMYSVCVWSQGLPCGQGSGPRQGRGLSNCRIIGAKGRVLRTWCLEQDCEFST